VLSKRLNAIAQRIPAGSRPLEVGCDHGRLACALAASGRYPRVIASDVSAPSLDKCRRLAERMHLGDRLELRLGDGLAVVQPGEVDTVILAGMGGQLMIRLLEAGKGVLGAVERLLLAPNRDQQALRVVLRGRGWRLEDETLIQEEGRFYPILAYVPGRDPLDLGPAPEVGPLMATRATPELAAFLRMRMDEARLLRADLAARDTEPARRMENALGKKLEQWEALYENLYGTRA
jgi:tRNA (adenine22-N1)-methyltransferase